MAEKNHKRVKKIVISAVVLLLLAGGILFAAYQISGVHFLGKRIHVNVQEEFYQYDMNGDLIGTIPVKIKGVLHENPNGKDFDGVVEVEGYELQYMEDWMPDSQFVNATMLYDDETGYVHLIIHGLKSVVEYNIPKFLHSDYQYNITFLKEDPSMIVVRVGQIEKKNSIQWPTIFYAVLAESEAEAAAWVADELEMLAQYTYEADGYDNFDID